MKHLSLKLLLVYLMIIPVFLTFAQTIPLSSAQNPNDETEGLSYAHAPVLATVVFSEDFTDNEMPPTDWTLDAGPGLFQINDGTHAGGTAPQGYINGWPQSIGTTRLISPVLDVSSYSSLELQFKHSVNSATYGDFSLKIETTSDGGTTWNEVFSVTPTGYYGGTTETISITSADLGSENFQFCLTYEATALQAIYHAYFDDFELTGEEIVSAIAVTFNVKDDAAAAAAIEGAEIALEGVETLTTDATGQAIFADVDPGTYTYDITAADFTAETGSVTVTDTDVVVDVVMATASVVTYTLPFAEDFTENVMPPSDWSIDVGPGNLQMSTGTHAGGTAPQGYINGWPQSIGTTRLISPVFDVSSYSSLELQFKHSVNSATYGDFSLKIETTSDGGTTWNEVFSVTPTGYYGGTTETISITSADLGSENFQFCLTYEATALQAIYHAYFDDFELTGEEIVSTNAVTFNVKDDAAAAIEGAQIALEGVETLTTDATGQAIFADVDPGTYTYDITAAGFVDQTGSVTVTDTDVVVDVAMATTSVISYILPFTEDFTDGAFPAEGWTVTPEGTTNWQLGTGNYSGGTAPEGYYYGWPQINGTSRLISPVITTDGYTSLELAFRHKCQGAANTDYSIKVETTSDGGTTWNEVFSVTPNGSWASGVVENISIENGDVGSENFQFCLSYVSTTTNGMYHYNFDEFSLTGIEAPSGYTLPFTEDFTDGACPAEGWTVTPEGTTNWQLGTGNYAGGTAPEGYYYGWPQINGTSRLISPVITTDGYTSLELAFRHKCQGAANTDYSIKVETTSDGGTTWNEVFSVTPNGSWASGVVENISIENGDVGSENFQFCLSYVSTTTNGMYHYNFDEFSLTGTEAPSGYPLPFTEDFSENVMPPTGWTADVGAGSLQINDGTNAGGTAPQGYINGWPQSVGTTRLISPVIDASSSSSLDLEFKYSVNGATFGNFSLKIETTSDGGTTWNEVWSVTPTTYIWGTTESISIMNADVGSDNFQFAYTYVATDAQAIYHSYFDDFELKETPESTYNVTFTVEDTDGNPIEGAEVAFEDAGAMTTDALGQVVLEDIEPGDYTYDITATDFVAASGSVTVTNADVEESVVLNAIQFYTATFNVSDGTNPIEGAMVSINEESITTDALGAATIELADGDYSYTVSMVGYSDETGIITVAGATVEESVALTTMVYYSATFSVSDGTNPIVGAVVRIGDTDVITDASGEAVIADLEAGMFFYGIFATGFLAEEGSETITDTDVTIDVTMGATTQYTLPFTEDFTAGTMPPTDWSTTDNGADGWGIKNTAKAGGIAPEGWFTCYLEGIIQGTTRLVSPVINTLGEETLKLDFKHKLQGRAGTAYSLSVETTSDGGATWNEIWFITPGASIDAEELTFIIDNSDVGSENFQYCLTYKSTTNYGAMNWWFDDFSLIGVEEYTLTFNVNDEDANPIEGAMVSINDDEITTDALGVATIPLFNGDYSYTITKEDFFDGTGTVTIADADLEESVTLAAWEGDMVTFTVTDGTNPIDGATVSIDGEELTADVDGVATITLPDGDYPYTVSKDEYYDKTGDITVAGASVEESVVLDFIHYYDVTFTVTDGTNPIDGAIISIDDNELTTDASGMATIELPNGDYPYAIQSEGYAQSIGTAIVADADVNIDAVLSVADLLFVERFEEGIMPPTDWNITPIGTANWVISESNFAGGEASEGKYYYFPFFQGITRLVTPEINTSAYGALELNFSHNLTTGENVDTYSIRVQTTSDGGTTWNEVWSIIPEGGVPLTSESITIENEDVGSPNFQFCIAYQASADRGIWHYYFDDFELKGVSSGEDVYSVTYNVKDEAQNPIEGAQVTMGEYGTVSTDALGQVIYTDVALGDYAWTVDAGSGFVEQSGTVTVADADIVFDLEMEVLEPVFPFSEDFTDNTMVPEGWTIIGGGDDNWITSSTINAGGIAPEAAFVNTPDFNGTTRLVSPVLNSTGIVSLMLDFKQLVDDNAGSDYSLKVETTSDGGTTWNEIWAVAPTGDIAQENVQVFIENADVGSENFQFAFTFEGNTTQINSWYFDNINLDVVQLSDLIHEEFTTGEDFPPLGWDIVGGGAAGWGKSVTSNAGGESSEMYFAWGPPYFEGTSRLVSPLMSTYAYSSLKLEFNQFVWVNGTDSYAYKVETSGDGGATWHEIFTETPQSNIDAEVVALLIDNEDVGSDNFKIAFTFAGNSHQINYWYVDNIFLTDGAGYEVYPTTFVVNDNDGNPIEGALVNMARNGEKLTDASGEATYENVFAGTYTSNVSKYRFGTETPEVIVVDEALTVNVDMQMSLLLLEEYFGGTFPPTEWSTDGEGQSNWNRSVMSTYAGGEAPEATFSSSANDYFTGVSRLVSPVVYTSDFTSLIIDLKQYVLDNNLGGGYSLKVETTSDGGTTWNEAWSISPTSNVGPQSASILIATTDVGSDNFQFAFTFEGNTAQIERWYIDDVMLFGALGYDAGVASINTPDLAIEGSIIEPAATVINSGFETVSFDVTFKISDATTVYSETLTVTDLAPLDEESVTFPEWTTIAGAYDMEVTVELVGDENADNDMLTQDLNVATGLVPLQQLYEVFTSSTCGPCVAGNAAIDGVLEDNPGEYSLIKYQVNFPGYGDPYYTAEVGERTSYYDVSYAPDLYINADQNSAAGMTQGIFDQYQAAETALEINVTEAIIGEDNMITVSADLNSIINYAEGLTAHIVVVEKLTTENTGSNGETEFHNVMMKMLPDASGTTLAAITTGTPYTITESYDMSLTNMETSDDLAVIIIVQDDTDKSIVQTTMIDVSGSQGNDVGITSIDSPNSGANLSNAETLTISLKNFGSGTQTDIPWEVSWTGPMNGSESGIYAGPLVAGETVSFDAGTADLSSLGDYIFNACTNLVGDETSSNDCTEKTVVHEEIVILSDVGITAIVSPNSGSNLSNAETVTVTINNFGTETETDITWEVMWEGPNDGSVSGTFVGPLTAEESVSFDVGTADLSIVGEYIFTACTYLVGDVDPSNDCTEKTVIHTTAPPEEMLSLYYEGEAFESGETVTILGDVTSSVLISEMGIQNDYLVAKDILVSKEIISEITGHTNTFCWGACYPENVFVSPFPITLEVGILNDVDFSGDLIPDGIAGTTTIKYTFFEENNPTIEAHFFVDYIVEDAVILDPPTDLTAVVDQDDVTLNWTSPAKALLSFTVYREDVIIANLTETTYLDENLSSGTYNYYVTAVYDEGESEISNEGSVTIGAAEINVTPMDIPFGEVLVGNTSEELITISNEGTVTLEVSDITSNDAVFYVNTTTLSIEPGTSEDVTITFEPSVAMLYEGEISIQSNDLDNATVIVEVSGEGTPTGTNLISEQGFVIYPNPATDKVFVEISIDVEKVQLVSSIGKIILEETFVGNKIEINTSKCKPGMYFLKLTSHDKEIIRKVVIE